MNVRFGTVTVEADSFESALLHLSRNHPKEFAEYAADRIELLIDDPAVQSMVLSARDEIRFQNLVVKGIEKVLFNHENRIRVLEGKAAVSAGQFRTAVKAVLGVA